MLKPLPLALALTAIALPTMAAELSTPTTLGAPSQSITISTPSGELLTIERDGSVRFGPAFTTTQEMAKETIRIIAQTYGQSLYRCPGIEFKSEPK